MMLGVGAMFPEQSGNNDKLPRMWLAQITHLLARRIEEALLTCQLPSFSTPSLKEVDDLPLLKW